MNFRNKTGFYRVSKLKSRYRYTITKNENGQKKYITLEAPSIEQLKVKVLSHGYLWVDIDNNIIIKGSETKYFQKKIAPINNTIGYYRVGFYKDYYHYRIYENRKKIVDLSSKTLKELKDKVIKNDHEWFKYDYDSWGEEIVAADI